MLPHAVFYVPAVHDNPKYSGRQPIVPSLTIFMTSCVIDSGALGLLDSITPFLLGFFTNI